MTAKPAERPLDHAEATSGRLVFVGDIDLPDQLHAAFVRSWQAHAVLMRIDATGARAVPGVEAVLTAEDLPTSMGRIQIRLREPATRAYLQPVLATERVRYVGEPVAMVLAESRRAAEDAADAVEVELKELPAVVSASDALGGGTRLFEDTNVAASVEVTVGDVDSALAGAAMVVEREFTIGRQTAMPMETRGVVARWEASRGRLDLWGPTKLPHYTRRVTAQALGLEPSAVRIREVRAGGGFGARGEVYPEDLAVAFAAIDLGRPVKWIEDRREHMLAVNHSREQAWRARMGFDREGRIVAVDASFVNDMGAYLRTHGTVVPRLAAAEFAGPYLIPAYRCRFEAAMTNKTPTGTCRSPGRFEATFVRERILDIAACTLQLDAVEIRRRNLVPAERMPFDTGIHLDGLDVVYDSGDYLETLEMAAQLGSERHRALTATVAGGRRLGFGIAAYNEATGHGPAETAVAELLPGGELELETGAPSLGQGHETVLAEVAASAAGWPLDRVRVRPLDTDSLGTGGGTWASRGATIAAAAVHLAARALRDSVVGLAADQMGLRPSDVQLGPDGAAGPEARRAIALTELLRMAGAPDGLRVERAFRPTGQAFPYGATAVTVAVDPDTGGVDVLSMVIAADVGRALNREVVCGQLQGAAVQGIGGALLEELAYSDAGQPLTTTFVDYLLPSAADVPAIEVRVLENHPSPITPLGAKGAGELGILGSAPAIAGAIADALRPATVEFNRIPIRPEDVARAAAGEGGR